MRRAAKDFKKMSVGERIEYLEAKIQRCRELENFWENNQNDPRYGPAMVDLRNAYDSLGAALAAVHGARMPSRYLSTWGKINRWVSEWAERDRAREAQRRGRCPGCNGYGKVVGAGNWFETCGTCGGSGASGWQPYY